MRGVTLLVFPLIIGCSGFGTHQVLTDTDGGALCFPETEAETCSRYGVCGVVNARDNCSVLVRVNCEPCDGSVPIDSGPTPDAGALACGGNGQVCCAEGACNNGLMCVGVVCLPADGPDGGADAGLIDAGTPSDGGVYGWRLRTPATSPPARKGSSMTYDPVRGVSMLFGGESGVLDPTTRRNFVLNDTWEWNGTTWTQRMPATSSPIRQGGAMTYDSGRAMSVLFGGTCGPVDLVGGQMPCDDTWEWDGVDWIERSPSSRPSAGASGNGLAYDAARGVSILFADETWEWDGAGAGWSRRPTADTPLFRGSASMAYDSVRRVIVLFGGYGWRSEGASYLNDTWEWNGRNWNLRRPATSPPARLLSRMAYDSARGVLVLFGGQKSCSHDFCSVTGDTWEWDGTNWIQIATATSPPAREGHTMVYDSARGVVVLFGGGDGPETLGDTWEYGRLP